MFKEIIKLIIDGKFNSKVKKKIETAITNNLAIIRKNLYGF